MESKEGLRLHFQNHGSKNSINFIFGGPTYFDSPLLRETEQQNVAKFEKKQGKMSVPTLDRQDSTTRVDLKTNQQAAQALSTAPQLPEMEDFDDAEMFGLPDMMNDFQKRSSLTDAFVPSVPKQSGNLSIISAPNDLPLIDFKLMQSALTTKANQVHSLETINTSGSDIKFSGCAAKRMAGRGSAQPQRKVMVETTQP